MTIKKFKTAGSVFLHFGLALIGVISSVLIIGVTGTKHIQAAEALNATSSLSEQQEQEAFKYVRKLRAFYMHLLQYLVVTLALLAVNLFFTPHHLWFFWVMGGWGFGVLLHASRVFGPNWLLGPEWERQQVEMRLRRPL